MPLNISFIKTEQKEKLPVIDSDMEYTIKDFKTASKLAKEMGEKDSKSIEDAMKAMKRKGVYFISKQHKIPVIYGKDYSKLKVHPLGLDLFKEFYAQQKATK